MKRTLIKNATLVNEGQQQKGNVLISGEFIDLISESEIKPKPGDRIIDADEKLLLPGIIDDQVHFRDPGLTHKGDIFSESRAAIAGGITSFMEMPNTKPQTINLLELDNKFELASKKSLANFSFYLGATNDNIDQLLKVDPKKVCGIKVFMGASTGNMLVDNIHALNKIFSQTNILIATHCEDEATIQQNSLAYKEKYGEDVPIKYHPLIRSHEACYKSSSLAVELATKYSSRLHILHVSTAKELELLSTENRKEKKITAEVCVHHLWFEDSQYDLLGSKIKWNPAIKTKADREALQNGLKLGKLDVIATDHAPHTSGEKDNTYFKAPSGGPLVQHSLVAMLELSNQGLFDLPFIVDKMCHAPADLFQIKKRGYLREGYFADLVLVNPDSPWSVNKSNIFYKCGWSPFEGQQFNSQITHTFVNGHLAYENGTFYDEDLGKPLEFNR